MAEKPPQGSFAIKYVVCMSPLEYSSLLLLGIYNTLNNKLKSTNFFWSKYTVLVKACIYRLVLSQLQTPQRSRVKVSFVNLPGCCQWTLVNIILVKPECKAHSFLGKNRSLLRWLVFSKSHTPLWSYTKLPFVHLSGCWQWTLVNIILVKPECKAYSFLEKHNSLPWWLLFSQLHIYEMSYKSALCTPLYVFSIGTVYQPKVHVCGASYITHLKQRYYIYILKFHAYILRYKGIHNCSYHTLSSYI